MATSISPIDQTQSLWLSEIMSNAVLPQSDKNNHYLKKQWMSETEVQIAKKKNKQQEMDYMHNGDGLPFELCE